MFIRWIGEGLNGVAAARLAATGGSPTVPHAFPVSADYGGAT